MENYETAEREMNILSSDGSLSVFLTGEISPNYLSIKSKRLK